MVGDYSGHGGIILGMVGDHSGMVGDRSWGTLNLYNSLSLIRCNSIRGGREGGRDKGPHRAA